MRITLLQSILISISFIVVLLVAPTVCAVSMDIGRPANNLYPIQESVDTSFAVHSSHHVLNSLSNILARFPDNSVRHEVISPGFFAGLALLSALVLRIKAQQYSGWISYLPPAQYHCRNYLRSEEPSSPI